VPGEARNRKPIPSSRSFRSPSRGQVFVLPGKGWLATAVTVSSSGLEANECAVTESPVSQSASSLSTREGSGPRLGARLDHLSDNQTQESTARYRCGVQPPQRRGRGADRALAGA